MTNTQQTPTPLTLQIDGMHCGNCVARVAKALTALDSVEVQSLAIGQASLTYDPTRVEETEITEAVTRAGYPAAPATR